MSFKRLMVGALLASQLLSPVSTLAAEYELLDEKPAVAEVAVNNTPNRIIVSFNGDTQSQMAFNWYTSEKFEDAKVWLSTSEDMKDAKTFEAEATEVNNKYGERDENGYFIFSELEYDEEGNPIEENGEVKVTGYFTDENIEPSQEWMGGDAVGLLGLSEVKEYSYKALASELEANTTYYYQVGSESGEKSDVGTFTTSGEAGEDFTFVQYTDTQNAYWNEHVRNEAQFGADTLKNALETAEADFVLHTGDFIETAEVEDEWIDIMGQSQESFLSVPVAPTAGNHDEYSLLYGGDPLITKFNEHMNVPAENDAIDGGSYYSYDYNGAHFVVMNTNDNKNEAEKAIGEEQMAWMKEDIQAARDNGASWIILVYHKPIFSRSYHSLQDTDVQNVRDEFMKQIDELDVDIALQGHDHVNSRTYPLNYVPSEENFSNGVIDEEAVANVTEEDGVEYYNNPQGTIFILPNTGGTKLYDDIYSEGLDHLVKVRPKLNWLTQEQFDYWASLFAFANQPGESEAFAESHSNNRDSSIQNFAVYTVKKDEILIQIYQVSGDLTKDEERKVELVHSFGIRKDQEAGEENKDNKDQEESTEAAEDSSEADSESDEESSEASSQESEDSQESSEESETSAN
ncbi:purple acid phosphatase family protein [Ignavigranum ruoffiae]|uniref:purple acid phosphatase family protein n=1 Tax=Ignavigranum ruoffiae TaxID=89093 RepID=UPI0024AD240A|nr:metallophosphoesterase family protein [Ignavigranum ruoffiae]